MPYIPRSLAPSGLGDSIDAPKAPARKASKLKPAVPYKNKEQSDTSPEVNKRRRTQMVGKLNMNDWTVDPLEVMKHLSGKEFKEDEYSGMVS